MLRSEGANTPSFALDPKPVARPKKPQMIKPRHNKTEKITDKSLIRVWGYSLAFTVWGFGFQV